MFVFLSFVSIFSASSTAASHTLPIQYGEEYFLRVPVNFIDSVTGTTFPGHAQLDFGLGERSCLNIEDEGEIIDITGISFGDVTINFAAQNNRGFVVSETDPLLGIAAGPSSILMNRATAPERGYLVAPTSTSGGVLVVNPESPTDFAFGNELFYTDQTPNSVYWEIPMAVRILTNEGTETDFEAQDTTIFGPCIIRAEQSPCVHNYPSVIVVPQHVFNGVRDILTNQNVSARFGIHRGYNLARFSREMYDLLPQIQFIMQADDQRHVSVVVLEPRDYIREISENNFFLRLRAFPASNNYVAHMCMLDRSILSKLVIHFDVHNHRIGFGEPLEEI